MTQEEDGNGVAEISLTDDEAFALLYRSFCFLLCLYVLGDVVCQKQLKLVPALVGQIVVGVVFGPEGADWFATSSSSGSNGSSPATQLIFRSAGELGLILMLCQAGAQMDLALLQRTGIRSVVMAVTGSLLPTTIGFLLAYFVVLEDSSGDWKGALAVGCSFGPTSAGIALAVLEQCQVLQTPVGQLVVAVAIVDDILALVILSQLRVLTKTDDGDGGDGDGDGDGDGGGISPSQIVIPIISAILWLGIGVFVAIQIMPIVLTKLADWQENCFPTSTKQDNEKERQDSIINNQNQLTLEMEGDTTAEESQPPTTTAMPLSELRETERDSSSSCGDSMTNSNGTTKNGGSRNHSSTSMSVYYATTLLLVLLPATYYSEASFFLGAFLSGLCLATHTSAANDLATHWKDVTEWLMRLFFGATIAFAIPASLWWEQPQTLVHGCLLALSLLGKLAVGPLLTPLLAVEEEGGGGGGSGGQKWDSQHWRDCLITGCSMAGEAEFAFVVAAFGLDQGLISESVYASVTFAILLSTVISPVLLRLVLAYTANAKPSSHRS